MQLISLSDLKTFLEKTDTTHDTLLLNIISYYSKRIETFCNRLFTKESRTEYFDAGNKKLYVAAIPIDLTTCTVTLDDDVQVINDDYFVWADQGLIEFFLTPCYIEPKQIQVNYYGGYNLVDGVVAIPDDLKFACVLQCAYVFRNRSKLGASSISMPDGSMSIMLTDFLPEVRSILKSYKQYNFA